MPHPLRFVPVLSGVLIIGLILSGAVFPIGKLCGSVALPHWLARNCVALEHKAVIIGISIALIALTLLMQWQRAQPAAGYDSDAGRWVVLGWVLAIGGTILLMAGMLLIGSNGWPLSRQSRHITIRTGALPLAISTVQHRYVATYCGNDGQQSLCASFGGVTVQNRSRTRSLTLDFQLIVTPLDGARATPLASMPARSDLTAIPRRGSGSHAIFSNPVTLKPRESIRRELVFVFRDQQAALSDRDYIFALAVNDRQSLETVSFSLPAEYRG